MASKFALRPDLTADYLVAQQTQIEGIALNALGEYRERILGKQPIGCLRAPNDRCDSAVVQPFQIDWFRFGDERNSEFLTPVRARPLARGQHHVNTRWKVIGQKRLGHPPRRRLVHPVYDDDDRLWRRNIEYSEPARFQL